MKNSKTQQNTQQTMPTTSQNQNLQQARAAKNDEFYTQLADIEDELKHYKKHFRNKVVLCNCDDPRVSSFFHYFSNKFESLKLKKLMATCYKSQERDLFSRHDSEQAISLEYNGDLNNNRIADVSEIDIKPLYGNGDFRSTECIDMLKDADVVVTNPPFSLFREYVAQLMKYKKKFLILGSFNAIKYTGVFPLIKANKVWLGVNNGAKKFYVPDDAEKFHNIHNGKKTMSMGNVVWYTNLDVAKRHENLVLWKKYKAEDYPKYDKYEAINVNRVNEIPMDYAGVMGVPITFLDKHNPDQFEILGVLNSAGYNKDAVGIPFSGIGDARAIVNDEVKYARLLIRPKQN